LPLYEYKCEKCANKFEKIEKYSAPTTQKCPKCGGKAARQISAAGIAFKGSGWYVTDYKGKNSGSAPAESSGDGGGSKSSDKSADAKSGDTKSSETKSGEGKSSDSKSSETKSPESKTSESKSSETKSSIDKGSSKRKK
jgi:putative FmdB family regulatory protein